MAQKKFRPSVPGTVDWLNHNYTAEEQLTLTTEQELPNADDFAAEGSELRNLEVPESDDGSDDATFMERTGMAWNKYAFTNNLVRSTMDEVYYPPDANYKVEDFADQLMEGIDSKYEEELLHEPTSLQEAITVRKNIMEGQKIDQELMQGGLVSGMAAMMLGATADPTMIFGMVAEAKMLNTLRNAGRMTRGAAAAVSGGTLAAAEVATAATVHDDITTTDIMLAAGMGAGINGALGVLFKGAGMDDLAKHADEVDVRSAKHMTDAADEIDDPTRAARIADDEVDPLEFHQLVDDAPEVSQAARKIELEETHAAHAVEMETYKVAKAAQTAEMDAHKLANKGKRGKARSEKPVHEKLVKPIKVKQPKHVTAAEAVQVRANAQDAAGQITPMATFREGAAKLLTKTPVMSDAVRLGMQKSAVARSIMSNLMENASGLGGRLVNKTAAQMKNMQERVLLEMFQPTYTTNFHAYRKLQGVSRFNRKNFGEVQEGFNKLLREEMERRHTAAERGVKYLSEAPAHIKNVADDMDKMNFRSLQEMTAAGVYGADVLKAMPGYIPLKWVTQKIGRLTPEMHGNYVFLLARSYESMNIDAKTAKHIANAVLDRGRAKYLQLDTNVSRMFGNESREFLEQMLRDSNMATDDIVSVLRKIDGRAEDAGKAGALKARTSIDLNAKMTTKDGTVISLQDLVDNDINTLMSRHASEQSGRSALARHGLKRKADVDNLREGLAIDLAHHGDEGADKTLKAFDQMMDEFHGRPIGGGHNKAIRRFMDWTTLARLGQVGIAQFAEANNLLASHGVLNVMKATPALLKVHRQLKRAAKTGNYDDLDRPFMRELMTMGGSLWDEHLLFRTSVRLDDAVSGGSLMTWDSSLLSKLDTATASGMDALGYVSGLYKMKAMQQQMNVILQVQKVVDMMGKGGVGKDKVMKRLADSGLGAKELKRLAKEFKHIEFTGGKNNIVNKLNLDKWEPKTREDFIVAMHRHTNQMVQLPMIGERNVWQSNSLVAAQGQFKSFSRLAIEKQAARNIRMADGEALAAATYGMGLSTMAVMGKSYLNSLGRPDADEYLAERLTIPSIITGATQYAGIFAPVSTATNIADTMGMLPQGFSRRGSRGRSAGFDLSAQVPAAGLVTQASRAITAPVGWLHGDDVKLDRTAKDGIGASAFGNTLQGVWISNLLQSALE